MILATYFKRDMIYARAAIYFVFFHETLKPSIFSMPLNILWKHVLKIAAYFSFIWMDRFLHVVILLF